MALALVLVSVAFAVTLGLLLFGPHRTPSSTAVSARAEPDRLRALESDAERRRREAEEAKAVVAELRAELKQTKRKLHEQRNEEKGDQELVRARTEVERAASQQLEIVRGELSHALAELAKLRADAESSRTRGRPAAAPVAPAVPAPAAPAPVAPPPTSAALPPDAERGARRLRELSEADREKMERLEHQANRERTRAQELQAEVRRLKGRTETQHRVWVVTKGELDLLKDKFKALEKRLNRTLLERDLMKRAIGDLERRTGLAAGRTELTQEEIALSDKGVEERSRTEAERLEQRAASAAAPVSAESNGSAEAPTHSQPAHSATDTVAAEQENPS
jgi:chromosome segregation ATPase